MTQKIINLGILAHVDAGKTTLTEGFLYHSGIKKERGAVDRGTTTTDSMELERSRGISIRASTVSFEHHGVRINLIDTPGHMDFIAEVLRSLSVLDGVILVVSAREGVQSQTRAIWLRLRAMGIPTVIFINKVDRMGVEIEEVLAQIRSLLSSDLLALQQVSGAATRDVRLQALPPDQGESAQALELLHEGLFERAVLGETLADVDYWNALRALTAQGKVFPVLFGSALNNIGVAELLDAVTGLFAPQHLLDAPLCALVYKFEYDPKGHRLFYLRVFTGSLALREKVKVGESTIQIKALRVLREGKSFSVDRLEAGEIGLLPDAEGLRCGDVLGEGSYPLPEGAPALLEVSAEYADLSQRKEVIDALNILNQEDPSLEVHLDSDTGEILLRLYGTLQREILISIMRERFGLEVSFSQARLIYRETPRMVGRGQALISDRDHHLNAGMAVRIEPLPRGSGFVYENHVSYGYLEKPFQNGALEGIIRGLREGSHWEITDIKVVFEMAQYDSVNGTPGDFRAMGPLVIRRALRQSGTILLEPWQRIEIYLPAGGEQKLLWDISLWRGEVERVEYRLEECVIIGELPMDALQACTLAVGQYSGGRGLIFSSFSGYREIIEK